MAAPLAVLSATEKLAAAVSNDILVLNGRLYRTVRVGRKKVLEPVDVQLHVNPAGIGLGLLSGAIGLFAADLAWNGVHFAIPYGPEIDIIKGLKSSPYWQGVVEKWTAKKLNIGAGYLAPTQERKKLRTPIGHEIDTVVTHTKGGDLAQISGTEVGLAGQGSVLVRVDPNGQVLGVVSPNAALEAFR